VVQGVGPEFKPPILQNKQKTKTKKPRALKIQRQWNENELDPLQPHLPTHVQQMETKIPKQ
jgi:hypothetical protein